jgi:hypothetical protein
MPIHPHYVRFARSLALASTLTLPACSSPAPEPPPAGGETKEAPSPDTAAALADAAPDAETPVADAAHAIDATPPPAYDAGGDALPGKTSGPLPPPELPAGFA